MTGSIQKKGKTYYAVIPIKGRRKWFKGGTKKDAERKLAEKVAEVVQGTYLEIPKTTFKDYAGIWLKSYGEVKLKASTLELYKLIIDKHLTPVWGDMQIDEIRTPHIQMYMAGRLKKVTAKTVCNETAVIKKMLRDAHRWGYVRTNQAEYLQKPRVEKQEMDLLDPAEIGILMENATEAYRLAFHMAAALGLRAGELWGLQWDDIDWHAGQACVRRSLWKGNFQSPKSKTSVRKVDMPAGLILELKKWKLRCPISKDDLVFPNTDGEPSCHNTVLTGHFQAALRRAKLRKVSFHSLRHTNASLRIQVGQNMKYISTQLGHSSINITMDRYGHLFNDRDFNRSQVELLEAGFQPSVRNPLEKSQKEGVNEKPSLANPLILFGAEART